MKKYTLERNVIATDEKVWVGIDAHKKTLHVSVVNRDQTLLQRSFPHDRAHVAGLIERLPGCEIEAVYEAGPTGYKLLYWLRELGCEAFMTPPSRVPRKKGGKQIKTDARDSLELAELLRADMLEEVHDLGEQAYSERELTRTRQQLVEQRSKLCTQIKSKLDYHSVRPPAEISTNWTKAFLEWLESHPADDKPEVNFVLSLLVGSYRHLTLQIKDIEAEIDELAQAEHYREDVELVSSVPGIGVLSAMILLTELGDVSRFGRCEEFSSFLGLVPCEWSSGQSQYKGPLTRAGNKRARTVLVESSWRLKGYDERMEDVYERIRARSSGGKAIVAVARRLGLAVRAMLRDRTPYDYQPGA